MASKTTSLGRGRGWAQNNETSLRRPGGTPFSKSIDCTSLISVIESIKIETVLSQKAQSAIEIFNTIADAEKKREMVKELMNHALNDKEFISKLVLLFSEKSFNTYTFEEPKSQEVRRILTPKSAFWNNLQDIYTRREEIRKESIRQFRNSIFLMSATYENLPNYRVLNHAIIDYLNMLLEMATEDDIKIVAIVIVKNRKLLYNQACMKLKEFAMATRNVLITQNLDINSRAMLLYILDVINNGYQQLPLDIIEFYHSLLGENSFLHHEIDDPGTDDDVIVFCGCKQMTKERSQPRNKRNTTPRAIRGSGSKKTSPRYKNNP